MRHLSSALLASSFLALPTLALPAFAHGQDAVPPPPDVTVRAEADVVIPPPPTVTVTAAPEPMPPAQTQPAQTQPVQVAYGQPAQQYTLAPPEMRVEHRMNRGLAIAGGAMFGISWGVNILGSSLGGLLVYSGWSGGGLTYDQMFGSSFIPVIGPLIFAGVAFDHRNGTDFFGAIGLIDAAAQIAGLTMLIIGIIGEDVEVNAAAENHLYVLPYASSQGAGVTANGTF